MRNPERQRRQDDEAKERRRELALLNDPDGRVQSRALEMLLPIVDLFWAESLKAST